jgi:uncharacterized protein YkwD
VTVLKSTFVALALLAPAGAWAGSFEDQVLTELNRVRADPAALARELRASAAEDAKAWDLSADPKAVDEAIEFLSRQAPLPPLRTDGRLAEAALEHAAGQGATGELGHGPPGSLGLRIQGRGLWPGLCGETISYGQTTPSDVVRQLIVDFGVADRGHRQMIFSQGFELAGVACGPHKAYGSMCVIDLAGALPPRD